MGYTLIFKHIKLNLDDGNVMMFDNKILSTVHITSDTIMEKLL